MKTPYTFLVSHLLITYLRITNYF